MHTNIEACCRPSQELPIVRAATALLLGAAVFFCSERAHALVNVGAEAGLVKRSADTPNNFKAGVGYGVHGELDLLPLIKVGPYYLHYELSSADEGSALAQAATDIFGASAVFNTLGLRARLMLPVPGAIKPYAYIGAGYTWVGYTYNFPSAGDRAGHFLEIPIGVGAAWEVLPLLQISLDAAYRPASSFGGAAYNDAFISHPSSGYSVLLGVAVNL